VNLPSDFSTPSFVGPLREELEGDGFFRALRSDQVVLVVRPFRTLKERLGPAVAVVLALLTSCLPREVAPPHLARSETIPECGSADECVALLYRACGSGDGKQLGEEGVCHSLAADYATSAGSANDPAKAAALYEKACELGHGRACDRLGAAHQHGEGVPLDLSRANALFDRACQLGEGWGCRNLGWNYGNGAGVPKDDARAAALYERACQLGNGSGCNGLALASETGAGVPPDLSRAHALYEKACDLREALGCANLALDYKTGSGVGKDLGTAAVLNEKACELGDGGGCNWLGWAYQEGAGVPVDLARANALYGKACQLGDGWGCRNLGWNYANGAGAPKDDARAAAIYERACQLGNGGGCTNLGLAYEDGAGVSPDMVRANSLYEKACGLGSGLACSHLGWSFEKGRSVPRDPARASALYAQACLAGEGLGCRDLAFAHQVGRGVAKDAGRAASLFETACGLGNGLSCTSLGTALERGVGIARDPVRASSLYEKGCRLGSAGGCQKLGGDSSRRAEIRRTARRSFATTCAQGDEAGCGSLAWFLGPADEPDPEAVVALASFVRRQPDRVSAIDDDALLGSLRGAAKHLYGGAEQLALLEALSRAGWEPKGPRDDATSEWADLVRLQLARGRSEDAAETLRRRVRNPYALLSLRADRRAEKLARERPELFDVDLARASWVEYRRTEARSAPRSLLALVHLAEALNEALAHEEVLEITRLAIEEAEADPSRYDDTAEYLGWVRGARSTALERLGRWEEAMEALRPASAEPSQIIHLARLSCQLDRPREALATVERAADLTPYGHMRVESVRLRAAVETGDGGARMQALSFLREHESDSVATLQEALVAAGEIDEASRLLVARLADEGRRAEALLEVQLYADVPLSPRMADWTARWRDILARPDVRDAIARVGKVERHRLAPP
jgi:TPR repeat protein